MSLMELELKKYVVEMNPEFIRKLFFEVEAKDQEEAIQLASNELVNNESLSPLTFVEDCIEWSPICRSIETHRSLINARHKKKNKKENITIEVNARSNVALGNRSDAKIRKVPGVVAIGERESVEQFSSGNVFDDVVDEKMGEQQQSNGFVDGDCGKEEIEVVDQDKKF